MEVNHCGDVAGGNQPQLKQSKVVDLRVPEEAVPGSEKCVVNVIGEYLVGHNTFTYLFATHNQLARNNEKISNNLKHSVNALVIYLLRIDSHCE